MDEKRRDVEEEGSQPDKRKKIKKVERSVLSVLLVLILLAGGFTAGWFCRWGALGKKKQSLLWAIDTAKDNYYREIDEDALYDNLFAAFDLDPYSTYYPPIEYEGVVSEREGQNHDAGFSVWQDSHLEVYVAESSYAEEAGIESGAYFLKYGKTNKISEMFAADDAESYFDFLTTVDANGEYYVLCGGSENESEATVYKLTNGANGAGLSLTRKYDPMRIYQVVGNSPADKAGLKRGMYILKYGATSDKAQMRSGSYENFRAFVASLDFDLDANGKKTNSKTFYLQCSFDETADPDPVKITIAEYAASYCFYRDSGVAYRFRSDGKDKTPQAVETDEKFAALDKDTAYISLIEFTGNAADEFKECLKKMKERERKNLILDLRGNGGGYMNVFAEIAACLMKNAGSGNQKVAYAKFRSGATVSYSTKAANYGYYFSDDARITVLADEYTASASECLLGVMIDYETIGFSDIYLHENGKGVARTYGKGIMQTSHDDDPSGGALKLTSAEIFWPKSDRSIHGVGVTPKDGANAIKSSLLPDEADFFLQEVLKALHPVL